MKLTYDPRHNVAYIHLKDQKMEVQSVQIYDDLIVDIAPDGTIYGIELLNANKQIKFGKGEKLTVINEETNKSQELVFA